MRKYVLIALGLMLGLISQVYSLDKQAEITGASNYKGISFSTTKTSIFDGDGVFDGIVIPTAAITSPTAYVVAYDSATGTTGSEILKVYVTTTAVLGGGAVFSIGDGTIQNLMIKFPTPIRVNKGLHIENSSVGFRSITLFRRLSK